MWHIYLDAISTIIFNEIRWYFFLYGQTRTKNTICVKIFKILFFCIGQKYLKFGHFFICALNRNGKWQ